MDLFRGKGAPVKRPDETLTAYDARGREVRIKRADWVTGVLAPGLEKAWNEPKELATQIIQALRDDFVAQVVPAAERLLVIDHESENALVLVAIVRMETGDLDGADRALRRSIENYGPTGTVLTNLAKVLHRRGMEAESVATLRRGLAIDPNQEALLWWAALAREAHGEAGYVSALEEISREPNAWRPHLWMARQKLKEGDREGALALYDYVLARAADEANVLMDVTGDLGNAGALEELVRLAGPRYKPAIHGPPAGFNLVEALKRLGHIEEAREVVRAMSALRWAPFAAKLGQLESELAAATPPKNDDRPPTIVSLVVAEPLWTRNLYDAEWLLPARSTTDPRFVFVTLAGQFGDEGSAQIKPIGQVGRLTRGLPLYLAEVLRLHFHARTEALLLISKGQGPAVFSSAFGQASTAALGVTGDNAFLVSGAVSASGVALEVWSPGSTDAIARISVEAPLEDVGGLTARLEHELISALKNRGLLTEAVTPKRRPMASCAGSLPRSTSASARRPASKARSPTRRSSPTSPTKNGSTA